MQREKEITDLLARKDQAAIAMIYDYYAAALYGTILRIVQSEAVAEDVLQDTLLKVWRYADRYDSRQGRLFTWLINIARNTAIDAYRSKSYRQQSENQSLEFAVNHEAQQKNTDSIGLNELLGKLDEKHKELIELAYFKGYTQAEISEFLELPLGTVKTRMRSALQALRVMFEDSEVSSGGNQAALLLVFPIVAYWERETQKWKE